MKTKKRLFKPTHQQPSGLVLAYTCESDSLAVVPDSLAAAQMDSLAAAQMDSLAMAYMDSICAVDRIEPNPGLDPIGGLANALRNGIVKGITSVAKSVAKSEAVEAIKEWWNDEDEDE